MINYIPENLKEFAFSNLIQWHNNGFTGKGITIANMESTDPNLWFYDGKVRDPFGLADKADNNHGQKTMDIIHQAAPDADLVMVESSHGINSNCIYGKLIDVSLPYIEKNCDFVNASLGGTDNEELKKLILKAQEKGVIFCASAGNEGSYGTSGYAKSNAWIGVAAVYYRDSCDAIERPGWSSIGPEVDFAEFTYLNVHDCKDRNRTFQFSGTSCSSPHFTGKLACVQQFFLEKAGRKLYQDEMVQFVKDNAKDLGDLGFDNEYGFGLLILPDPKKINVSKYLTRNIKIDEKKQTTIKIDEKKQTTKDKIIFKIGKDTVNVNGIEKKLYVAPKIDKVDKRTVLGVRDIAEINGYNVEWVESTQEIILTR